MAKISKWTDANNAEWNTEREADLSDARIAIEKWTKANADSIVDETPVVSSVRIIAFAPDLAALLRAYLRLSKVPE